MFEHWHSVEQSMVQEYTLHFEYSTLYCRVSGSIRNNDHRPNPGVMSIRGVLVYGVLVGSRMLQETGTGWMVYKYSVL